MSAPTVRGKHAIARLAHCILALSLLAVSGGVAVAFAPSQKPAAKLANSTSSAQQSEGEQLFSSNCAACHGLDGRGNERAPSLVASQRVRSSADAELEALVKSGLPGKGMPSFGFLGSSSITLIIAHLRTLQGSAKPVDIPGDPVSGKDIFFGKAACSSCHMVRGNGGFLGTDLSNTPLSPEHLRSAIVSPKTTPGATRSATLIVTGAGQRYVGIVRNEDNFAVQLQTEDGEFHTFEKSGLQKLQALPDPYMPGDYRQRLTDRELDDLIHYLVSVQTVETHSKIDGED
jgi:cytochrome c oxidase cbb3-type subunit 3